MSEEKALFLELLKVVERNTVPLSAFWGYDHSGQDEDWNVTFENRRSYMLRPVADANRRLRAAGPGHERIHTVPSAEADTTVP